VFDRLDNPEMGALYIKLKRLTKWAALELLMRSSLQRLADNKVIHPRITQKEDK